MIDGVPGFISQADTQDWDATNRRAEPGDESSSLAGLCDRYKLAETFMLNIPEGNRKENPPEVRVAERSVRISGFAWYVVLCSFDSNIVN